MRYLALFLMCIFIWFAYLQINDPDPIWWIAVYLVPAYISWKAYRHQYSVEMLSILTFLYSAYMITSWLSMGRFEGFFTEGAGMEMKTPNQEFAREAAGLAICVGVYLMYMIYVTLRRKEQTGPLPGTPPTV